MERFEPPAEWTADDEWIEAHRDSIERAFVALRRECLQTAALDPTFCVRLRIRDFANFVSRVR